MKKIIGTILAGAALLGSVPALAETRAERGEARLARALEGYAPGGEPVRCLNSRDIRSTEILDGVGILYRTSGKKVFLNRPRSGANSLDRWDILVTKLWGTNSICSNEVVHLVDGGSRIPSGFVFLGDFVPYTKMTQAGTR